MAYCARSDIYPAQIATAVVIQLTDDTRTKVAMDAILEAVVDKAITDAEAEIDSRCEKIYLVPLTPVPAIIRKYCVDLAIGNLYARRDIECPVIRELRCGQAREFLEMLVAGDVTLGAATPAAVSSPGGVSITSDTPRFKKEDMEGF